MAWQYLMGQDDGGRTHDGDAIADVLSHPVRHRIVERLRGREGEGLRYLSIVLARREARRLDTSIASIGFGDMLDEIESTHVPALEGAGLIHYDPDTEWLEMDGAPPEYVDSEFDDE